MSVGCKNYIIKQYFINKKQIYNAVFYLPSNFSKSNKSSVLSGKFLILCSLFKGFFFLVVLGNESDPLMKVSVDLLRHCFIVINSSISLIVYQYVSPICIEQDSKKSTVLSLKINNDNINILLLFLITILLFLYLLHLFKVTL